MHNSTAAEASADLVGSVFARHFREQEALRLGALEIEDPDLIRHAMDNYGPNTGCDRLAVVDELLPLNAAERAQQRIRDLEDLSGAVLRGAVAQERIRELEGQVAILKAMWTAPKPVAMAAGGGEMIVVRDDGVCFTLDMVSSLQIMTWRQIETVPGTPADLAEQFGKHNLRTA